MVSVVTKSNKRDQLRLLCNHPDLAQRISNKKKLTEESTREQGQAGLNNCTITELEELRSLNKTYKKKFGFPFILAVKDRNVNEIIALFRIRIKHTAEEEFNESLKQVYKIAFLRLEELFSERQSKILQGGN